MDKPTQTEVLAAEIETLMRRLLIVDPEFFQEQVDYYAWQARKIRATQAVLRHQAAQLPSSEPGQQAP